MRKGILILVLAQVCLMPMVLAQNIDYNKIILPEGAQDVSFEEKLVQLAWKNNPETQIYQEETVLAKEDLKASKTLWTDYFGVAGNLNEFNINAVTGNDPTQQNQFFPRYNVYGRLPLSMVFHDPHKKKAAASRVKITEHRVNALKLEIRAMVLKLYQDVKLSESVWLIRQQTMADEESNFLLVEQKFKNGEALVEEYMRAQRSRNDIKIQVAIAESDYIKAKLELEKIIGLRLEDVK